MQAIITEYVLKKYRCKACRNKTLAGLPTGIPYSSFGPKLMGLLTTLTGIFHLSKRESIQLIKDIYDINIGVGSVIHIEERVSDVLDPIYHRIHKFIIENNCPKHFDETGWRNTGKRHYVWIATNAYASFYMIDRRRNAEVFQRLLQNKNPNKMSSVTDRYGVYNLIGKHHQYCLAHLIRDFKFYGERDGPDKKIGRTIELKLKKVCKIHRKYKRGEITLEQRNKRIGHCKSKIKFWLEEGCSSGSDKLYGLCGRLLDNFDKLWTFTKIVDMEPTNNLAERDLRKIVLWRKKSYGTRSDRGKKYVERISSIAQSLRKQGQNALKFIQDVLVKTYKQERLPFINPEMNF